MNREQVVEAKKIERLTIRSSLPGVNSQFIVFDHDITISDFIPFPKEQTYHVISRQQPVANGGAPMTRFFIQELKSKKVINSELVAEVDIFEPGEDGFKECQDMILEFITKQSGITLPDNKTIITP
jgi:hypothetical protein